MSHLFPHQSPCPRCSSGGTVFSGYHVACSLTCFRSLFKCQLLSVRLSLTILLRRTQPFWSPFPAFFFSIAHSVIWSMLDILLIYFVYFFLQQECKLHQGRGFYVYCCNPRTSKSGWHGVGMQYVFIEQMNAYHYLKHDQERLLNKQNKSFTF